MAVLRGIRLHHDDLPENVVFTNSIAIDTETMGLNHGRDRLCLVQLSDGTGVCHLVKIAKIAKPAPRLVQLFSDQSIEKIFHYARFDVASIYCGLNVLCRGPIYCTKIASRLARTYTDHHGLRTICRELLSVDISKSEQSSDWGADVLTDAQKNYASTDVLHLHELKGHLDRILKRENRHDLFRETCKFITTRVMLDLEGFPIDIFDH